MQHTLPRSTLLALPESRPSVPLLATRRFPRRLFGVDPVEVNCALAATEEAVGNLIEVLDHERAMLEARLQSAATEAIQLRAELSTAAQQIAAYREREHVMAEAIVTAQHAAEELKHIAKAEADEIVGNAEAIASDIVHTSCRSASEILEKARREADAIVAAAKENATAFLSQLRAEAAQLASDAQRTFEDAQRTVEQRTVSLMTRLNTGLLDADASPPATRDAEGAGPPDATAESPSAVDPLADTAPVAESASPAGGPPVVNSALAWAVTGGAMSLVPIIYLFRRLLGDFRA
jgi:cell division septum initiation protein DivIVA